MSRTLRRGEVSLGDIPGNFDGDRLCSTLDSGNLGRGRGLRKLECGVGGEVKLSSASSSEIVQLGN